MHCVHCGAELNGLDDFCQECGKKQISVETSAPSQESPGALAAARAIAIASLSGRQTTVIVVLLCVCIAALGGYWLLGDSAASRSENATAQMTDEELASLRQQAEQGNASAQHDLGLMYDNGEGVPQDDTQAVAWYRQAADQGHVSAQFDLGAMYAKGRGVPLDPVEAHKWVSLAASGASAENQTRFALARDRLATLLPQERIGDAQQRASASANPGASATTNAPSSAADNPAVTDVPAPAAALSRRALETPDPPPSPSAPVRVGGAIEPPVKTRDVRPQYPSIARTARVQGIVIIEATIGADGTVQGTRILRSIPLLDDAALNAVRQWEFSPTLLNSVPVPVIMTVTVQFTLG